MKTIYKIIPDGKYKGKRLYDELKHDGSDVLPSEISVFFKNALNNDYKIFVLNCVPNHNIIIPQNDLDFLNKILDHTEDEDIYKNYKFSKNVIEIKELQYFDIKQLYDIAVKNNQIGSLFINPFLKDDFYCFNLCLIVTKDFDLNTLFNLNFNIIKINSVNEYIITDDLTCKFFKNLFDLNNTPFKDYIIPWDDLNKTHPYDQLELTERKEFNEYCQFYINFINNNPNVNVNHMEEKLNFLKKKWLDKQNELWDIELYKKFNFSKLCMHFYFFHEVLLNDCVFFTNFFQITGVVKLDTDGNDYFKINYNDLQPYALEDLFCNDPYMLFSITLPVYQWKKK